MVKRAQNRVTEHQHVQIPKWLQGVFIGILVLVVAGLMLGEWQRSQIVGHASHRFNLALIAPEVGVTFVSFDPAEQALFVLPFPSDLSIPSRKSGEYSITSLYKLGAYSGEGGMFARQKIQGFMRVPIPGYAVVTTESNNPKRQLTKALLSVALSPKRAESSLSRFDALVLLSRLSRYSYREVGEEELVRAAVIEKKEGVSLYHPERLQEFVGSRLFDWGLGAEGVTVAVLNASGENGLGSDMADFLTNLGFDVVMVRSVAGGEMEEVSHWQVADERELSELTDLFASLFGFAAPTVGVAAEYRSQVVIWVGKDAKELF